ncbi:hypothetical protein WJX84_008309 [Apatococcus fuscideae]|uniref:Uncharacterized protein n=1 Tax=Apatococcus fuscideae TaxID=2026836 RepID=A0AAW1TG08_9CHLO
MAANAQAADDELNTIRADLARAIELGIENADSSEEMLQSSLAWEARHNQVVGMLNNANTQVVTISRCTAVAGCRVCRCAVGLHHGGPCQIQGCPGAGRPLGMSSMVPFGALTALKSVNRPHAT